MNSTQAQRSLVNRRDSFNYNTSAWLWENYRSVQLEKEEGKRKCLRIVSGHLMEIDEDKAHLAVKSRNVIARFSNDDDAKAVLIAAGFIEKTARGISTYHAK